MAMSKLDAHTYHVKSPLNNILGYQQRNPMREVNSRETVQIQQSNASVVNEKHEWDKYSFKKQ